MHLLQIGSHTLPIIQVDDALARQNIHGGAEVSTFEVETECSSALVTIA